MAGSAEAEGTVQPDEQARPAPALDKRIAGAADLLKKVDLMEVRLKSMDLFSNLSLGAFIDSLPGFERLMPLLAQSVVDISHGLLRRYSIEPPRSTYDIIDMCEQNGILPRPLVRSLAARIVLIENGYERIDADEVMQIHRDVADTIRVFQAFIARSRELLHYGESK